MLLLRLLVFILNTVYTHIYSGTPIIICKDVPDVRKDISLNQDTMISLSYIEMCIKLPLK